MAARDAGVCELVVKEHLDGHWAAWVGADRLVHNDDGTTTLIVRIDDQTRLFGVLERLRDAGAALVTLTVTQAPGD